MNCVEIGSTLIRLHPISTINWGLYIDDDDMEKITIALFQKIIKKIIKKHNRNKNLKNNK